MGSTSTGRGDRAMRTWLAACLSIGLLTSAVAPALAQTPQTTKSEMKALSGTVKSATKDGFVVSSREGDKQREYAFSIDGTTMVRKGGQQGSVSDLRPGDQVTVSYAGRDGKAVAQTVTISAAARP